MALRIGLFTVGLKNDYAFHWVMNHTAPVNILGSVIRARIEASLLTCDFHQDQYATPTGPAQLRFISVIMKQEHPKFRDRTPTPYGTRKGIR